MYRPYLALIWDHTDCAKAELAAHLVTHVQHSHPDLTVRLRRPGVILLDAPHPSAGADAYVLALEGGAIYGRLFNRRSGLALTPQTVLADQAFARACAISARTYLIRSYWGSYIAIVRDQVSGNWSVIRDSSGMMPCYYTCFSGLTVACSGVSLAASILPRPTISWPYIAAFLAVPELQVRATGLENVCELLAGEALVISGDRPKVEFAWNPVEVSLDPIAGAESATAALQEAVGSAVSSWAAIHESIVLTLSGGFDSSLVLSLLTRAYPRPAITCVNRYADGAAEDERKYARIAAACFDATLMEKSRDCGVRRFDRRILESPLAEKPSVPDMMQALEGCFWNELIAGISAQAVWTGQGGDHLFISVRSGLGVSDCFSSHGLDARFRAALRNASRLTGQSFLSLMVNATAASISERAFRKAIKQVLVTHFLTAEGLHSVTFEQVQHPWYRLSASLPPGKRYHVLQAADVLNRHRYIPGIRHVPDFHPLLSQPVVETCLRIPVYILLAGGRSRGLARRAFAEYLPRSILGREQKGSAATQIVGLMRDSRGFVAELLVDGLLVREGLLSKARLNEVFSTDEPLRSELINPLFACAAAEVWARGWTTRQPETRANLDWKGGIASAIG